MSESKQETDIIPFSELPLEVKFNLILRRNQSLNKKNDLLTEYSQALEYKIDKMEEKIAKHELGLPEIPVPARRTIEIIKEKIIRVQTPDAIGQTLILAKRIKKLTDTNENLNNQCIKLTAENKALKKVLHHRR